MLGRFDFHVYVLALHPEADVSGLAARLGRPAAHLSRKGEKASARGRALDYIAPDSRCLVELATHRDGSLAEGVEQAAALLEPHRDWLDELRSLGGEITLFARWYPEGDTGETFAPDLLARLAAMGLSLGFNVFPGENYRKDGSSRVGGR